MEVELWLEHHDLVQRDVLELLVEAGNTLVHTRLVGEERTVRTDFLDLGGAELMEVESVVGGCCKPLHKWEVLR